MPTDSTFNGQWDAAAFFERMAAVNKLALAEGFTFCRVSGLEGFEEALGQMQNRTAFLCVSDIADGYTELNNSPRTRRVKTVFLAMRHAVNDMAARARCMETMHELFRQLMARLILEKTRLEENCIFIDPRISFNEVDRYFFSGCACAYFQIAVDVYTDLRINAENWVDGEMFAPKDPPKEDIPVVPPKDDIPDYSEPGQSNIWVLDSTYNKIKIIYHYRHISGLGLKEAKDVVESVPFVFLRSSNQEEIDYYSKELDSLTVPYIILPDGQLPTGT